MAFFKLRKGGDDRSAAPAPSESVEVMRKRAKYRLLGAAVLVLLGVIGFPLLFDKQPRPIAVDTPIEIPDKNKVLPLSIPAAAVSLASESAVAPPAIAASVQNIEKKEALAPVEYEQVATKKVADEEPKVSSPLPEPVTSKADDKPLAKAPVQSGDAAKVQALLDGKSLATPPDAKASASEGRFVVQIGAFADAARAREVRAKLEHAGLKTYTHVAKTKDGDRTRVRVGPFGTKAEADKAAEKIKKLDLPAAVLTL